MHTSSIRSRLCVSIMLAFFLVPSAVRAATLKAFDTVAGFETQIIASGLQQGEDVTFVIRNPLGQRANIEASTNAYGSASVLLDEDFTETAGNYTIALAEDPSASAHFSVFPSDVSASASRIIIEESRPFARTRTVHVHLRDSYGNGIPLHEVSLKSNRALDRLQPARARTSDQGIATFSLAPKIGGDIVLTAFDETVQLELEQQQIVSIAPTLGQLSLAAVGGDPLLVAQASGANSGSPAQASSFKIENLPASVNVNQTVSFKVSALTTSNQTATEYAGQINFSSTDPNAELPSQYRFVPSDRGTKTFNLGLTFRTPGEQTIIVQEASNSKVSGRKTVEVTGESATAAGNVLITKPGKGKYSLNSIEIAGQADPHAPVKIFENGNQIGEVQTQSSGRFSYQTPLLTDGKHKLQVESKGVKSPEVEVVIDSTPAQVEFAQIVKTRLAPGETTELVIQSDAELNKVEATVGDSIIDLQADPENPGVYRGNLDAPRTEGQYVVQVVLTDRLGNVSEGVEVGRITVDISADDTKVSSGIGKAGAAISFRVPSKVQNLTATPGPGRVDLAWKAAQAAAGISAYRIRYGTDIENLEMVATTKDSNPLFIVEKLLPGIEYFFEVVGVDANGQEGDVYSDIVSARTLALDAQVGQQGSSTPGLRGLGQNASLNGSVYGAGYGAGASGNGYNYSESFVGNDAGGFALCNRDGVIQQCSQAFLESQAAGLRGAAYGSGTDGGYGTNLVGYDRRGVAICSPYPCEMAGSPPFTPQDGPGMAGAGVFALASAGIVRLWRRYKRRLHI